MGYHRSFGMRSFENVVRVGRFRAPATGTPLVIGSPVMIDPATPGFVKQATDAVAPDSNCGLAVFEHIQNKSDALTTIYDAPYTQVPLGQYVQIMRGPGAKVWFKEVANKPMYDGRTQTAADLLTIADFSAVSPGDYLTPTADGKFTDAAADETNGWFVVEQVNPSTKVVEARFRF